MSLAERAVLLLARCVRPSLQEGVEMRIPTKVLDRNLRMYFTEETTCFAYDPKEQCKTGDVVLIKKLDEPMTRKITHEVLEVIYPLGDITDPITGKKVVAAHYREDMEKTDEIVGTKESSFTSFIKRQRQKSKDKVEES